MAVRSESPPEVDDGVTDLQEAVLGFLEDETPLPTVINDHIVGLVAFHERKNAELFGPETHHSVYDFLYRLGLVSELRRMADKLEKLNADPRCAMCRATGCTACHCKHK